MSRLIFILALTISIYQFAAATDKGNKHTLPSINDTYES